jgi:hypothetical protein
MKRLNNYETIGSGALGTFLSFIIIDYAISNNISQALRLGIISLGGWIFISMSIVVSLQLYGRDIEEKIAQRDREEAEDIRRTKRMQARAEIVTTLGKLSEKKRGYQIVADSNLEAALKRIEDKLSDDTKEITENSDN